jgi:sugar phosphate isomerase/epimerase
VKLGFVSAILPDLTLSEVFDFAAGEGYDCVEVMCWPPGKAKRRYAGVTHIDVTKLSKSYIREIQDLVKETGVEISSLGYYPNPMTPDKAEAKVYRGHIKKVITASAQLGVNCMTTFIGRDWTKSVDDNWSTFKQTWKPIIKHAEKQGVKVGIENCPMLFSGDEWPGGKNLAISPKIWRSMFEEISSKNFGLNYDPSHLVWMQMDYLTPIRDFADRFHHVHAKDVRVDQHRLDEVGILAHPLEYHTPKLPGLGEVNWGKFFSYLTESGYDGPVCVEVEDRAYEGAIERRKAALRQSAQYLRQYL